MDYKFDEKELQVMGISKDIRGAEIPLFHFPISKKEEWYRLALQRKPLWMGTAIEVFDFFPNIFPDNRARGFMNDGGVPVSDSEKGGKDLFGVEWVYVPVAGGSMEKPGAAHLLEDVNDWEDIIVWPDIDSWDWGGCRERNIEALNSDRFNLITMLNGCGFERLISFMGFENAAVALVDEDQHEAIKALFDKLADLYIKIIDKCCEYFNADGFVFHDDWGSQRAPFFSFEAGRDLIVPSMKKVTDYIHSKGKVAELHSCGANELQIENFIAAGWDIWRPMPNINDTKKLFEEYGDRIILGVMPEAYDPEKDSEDEIRAKARAFVDQYCNDPAKVCIIARQFAQYLKGVYAEELYKASRLAYEKNYG